MQIIIKELSCAEFFKSLLEDKILEHYSPRQEWRGTR